MGKKLYVGNLSYEVSSSDLEAMLSPHGTVQSAEVIMDRDTGRSKGFGFVEMASDTVYSSGSRLGLEKSATSRSKPGISWRPMSGQPRSSH